jgi:hypothetical protein
MYVFNSGEKKLLNVLLSSTVYFNVSLFFFSLNEIVHGSEEKFHLPDAIRQRST